MGKTMKAEELLEKCEKKAPWINIKVAIFSFTGNFRKLREKIPFKDLNEEEIDKFIEICDNRIDRARDFLSDVVTVFSLLIATLAIAGSILAGYSTEGVVSNSVSEIWEKSGILFQISTTLILVGIVILVVLLVHYRAQRHAWSAFKEGAILMKNKIKSSNP